MVACTARFGALRKVVLLLAVIVLLAVSDVAARRASETQLEERLLDGVPSATAASVRIDSVPFLGRLALSGHVSAVQATVDDVKASRLRFSQITVDLHDVRVDRRRLVVDRQLDLQEVERGTAVAEITQADLRSALGDVPVVLDDGRIGVAVGGATASVTMSLEDDVLRLSAGRVSIAPITLPRIPLLPCVTDAVARPGRLQLSCTLATVPDELLREVNRRLSGEEAAARGRVS